MINLPIIEGVEMQQCREDELTQVLELESTVLAHLDRPDQLRRNTPALWRRCLQPPHICLGAWDGPALVALAVLYVSYDGDPEALAPLLQKVESKNYHSANYKICLVHPDWRGHHLQVLMGRQLHEEARRMGINLLCATASPHNTASVKSLERLGYRPDHQVEKYGFERIVFYCFI